MATSINETGDPYITATLQGLPSCIPGITYKKNYREQINHKYYKRVLHLMCTIHLTLMLTLPLSITNKNLIESVVIHCSVSLWRLLTPHPAPMFAHRLHFLSAQTRC